MDIKEELNTYLKMLTTEKEKISFALGLNCAALICLKNGILPPSEIDAMVKLIKGEK